MNFSKRLGNFVSRPIQLSIPSNCPIFQNFYFFISSFFLFSSSCSVKKSADRQGRDIRDADSPVTLYAPPTSARRSLFEKWRGESVATHGDADIERTICGRAPRREGKGRARGFCVCHVGYGFQVDKEQESQSGGRPRRDRNALETSSFPEKFLQKFVFQNCNLDFFWKIWNFKFSKLNCSATATQLQKLRINFFQKSDISSFPWKNLQYLITICPGIEKRWHGRIKNLIIW